MTIYRAGAEDIDWVSIAGSMAADVTAGRFDSAYARCAVKPGVNANDTMEIDWETPASTLYCTFRMYNLSMTGVGSDSDLFNLYDVDGSAIMRVNGNNGIFHVDLDTGSGLSTIFTWAPNLTTNVLQKFTFKVILHATNGEVSWWLSDTLAGQMTGDTVGSSGHTGAQKFRAQNPSGTAEAIISEIIFADEDTSYMRVATLNPNGDGNSIEWTGAYTDIDEITESTADIITTDFSGELELTDLSNYGGDASFIVKEVFVSAKSRSTFTFDTLQLEDGLGDLLFEDPHTTGDVLILESGEPATIQMTVRHGTTDLAGTSQPLEVLYHSQFDKFSTNPATGNPWTVTELDLMESGVKSEGSLPKRSPAITTPSCVFNDDTAQYMFRDWGATPTDADKWTFSCWMKRTNTGFEAPAIFSAWTTTSNWQSMYMWSDDTMFIDQFEGSTTMQLNPTNRMRDTSAWTHVVWAVDIQNGTADFRQRVYVNGVEATIMDLRTNPLISEPTLINTDIQHEIGRDAFSNMDGYLWDCHFSDGNQYAATDFGVATADGIWTPKTFAGSYGIKGFHLDFADDTNLGRDVSGNDNHFTTVGLTAANQRSDNPTKNYATFCFTDQGNVGINNGGTKVMGDSATAAWATLASTWGMPDNKWYWEHEIIQILGNDEDFMFGIMDSSENRQAGTFLGNEADAWGLQIGVAGTSGDQIISWTGGSPTTLSDGKNITLNIGDTVMIAYDGDAKKIWWGYNGTWFDSGDPAAGTGEQYASITGAVRPAMSMFDDADSQCYFHADEAYWSYTAPTGFNALNTDNLTISAITDSSEQFHAVEYDGSGATGNAITGIGHDPDMVWLKNVDTSAQPILFDKVRGVGNWLTPDTSAVEQTGTGLASFDVGGYTINSTATTMNASPDRYTGWCWKEGTTGGFDIVTFSGTGSAHTEAHSLTGTPSVMIVKERTDDTGNWFVYHSSFTGVPEDQYIDLAVDIAIVDNNLVWNDTAPTSSVFTVGTHADVNGSGDTYVAYLWEEIAGFSKFAQFVGNTDADGSYVYCGFKPAMVWVKQLVPATNAGWYALNMESDPRNNVNNYYQLNVPAAQVIDGANAQVVFMANGFKVVTNNALFNGDGKTHIVFAWAERPFVGTSNVPEHSRDGNANAEGV